MKLRINFILESYCLTKEKPQAVCMNIYLDLTVHCTHQ